MFVADLHNDVLQRAFVGEDITVESNEGHSDLERLKKSCIDLEVFVIWVPQTSKNYSPFDNAIKLYEVAQIIGSKSIFSGPIDNQIISKEIKNAPEARNVIDFIL